MRLNKKLLIVKAALFIAIGLFSASVAICDIRKIYGVSFEVDEFSQIDDRAGKVVLEGRSRLMALSDADRLIVNHYFKDPERSKRFEQSDIQTFVIGALEAEDIDLAALGIRAFLSANTTQTEEQQIAFFEDLERYKLYPRAAQQFLQSEPLTISEIFFPAIFFGAAAYDTDWGRSKGLSLAFKHNELVRAYIKTRLVRELGEGLSGTNSVSLSLYQAIFGESDSRLQGLKVFLSRLNDAQVALKKGETELIASLANNVKDDKQLSEVVTPLLLDGIHEHASSAAAKGRSGKALVIISRLDPNLRTQSTHDIVRRSLNALRPEESTVLRDVQVRAFLQTISSYDEDVKESFLAKLDQAALLLVENNDPDTARIILKEILELRSDPSSENDLIRVQIGKKYAATGMLVSARDVLGATQTFLSPRDLIYLAYHGYHGREFRVFIWVVAAALSSLIIAYRYILPWYRRLKNPELAAKQDDKGKEEDGLDEPIAGAFEVGSFRLVRPGYQEYTRCLQVFGLEPGSSLQVVKSRYRSLIKEVHPDLKKDLSDDDRERFDTLTKTYDRLLELMKEINVG